MERMENPHELRANHIESRKKYGKTCKFRMKNWQKYIIFSIANARNVHVFGEKLRSTIDGGIEWNEREKQTSKTIIN